MPIEKIINCSTIGISSGASAPEVLVKNFINQSTEKYSFVWISVLKLHQQSKEKLEGVDKEEATRNYEQRNY